MNKQSNIERLTAEGVIPEAYSRLTDAEVATIDNMTESEIEAIIAFKRSMKHGILAKHAAHGMLY